jgi:putative peptide zinc metalloprotease protein
MEQPRPTFSESWYRVADLKIRLRASAQVSRQHYRGELWYVVRDPAGNQFHRLSAPAYRFIGLLDGTRTIAQAWDLVGGQLADDAPTQNEVIQILSQLHSANLLEADVSPDAQVLLRRHKRMVKRQWQGRLMNVLFPRIPLWNPDRFLQRWAPVSRALFSVVGALAWVAVMVMAVLALLPRGGDLAKAAGDALAIGEHPERAAFLWLSFVLIKAIHELGHAFACRRFGGEVHEMGIMFLVFVPTPYVDASSAWQFPSKWARIFVGAAGMIVELFVAAAMAFVWINTGPGFVHDLAYNIMLIASVSTILFNANPLLRYDGYYMLSDWLEIPNLRYRATEYSLGLIKRHLFGVKLPNPLPPPGQRVWLLLYAILSSVYRIFIGLLIILIVIDRVPVLGVLMAIGGIITWALVPVFKILKYLLLEAELHRKRARAALWSGAIATGIVLLIGYINFGMSVEGAGVTEPADRSVVRAREAGFVRRLVARDGQHVKKGDVLLVCVNHQLATDLDLTRSAIRKLAFQLDEARVDQPAAIGEIEPLLQQQELALAKLQKRNDALTLTAPLDGVVSAPRLSDLMDKFLKPGDEVAAVLGLSPRVVRANLDMGDAGMISSQTPFRVTMRPAGALDREYAATLDPRVIQTVQRQLSHAAAGTLGGGDLPTDPKDETGVKVMGATMWVPVQLGPDADDLLLGQRAYVRFEFEKRPLFWQWKRKLLQLFQQTSMSARWQ